MRNAFINELVSQARINPNIALIVGDLGFSVVEPFADEFPERFINAGVAEQNMMGIAAGMASEGYHPFVYSIANFPLFRCAEQIRNDVAYHNLPVTIVAVGGGLAYANLGYSHHAVQDYGLIRMMPNMLIAAPGDPMETRGCVRYLATNPQPSFLRLGKTGEPCLHDVVPHLLPGQWVPVRHNIKSSKVILSTGASSLFATQMLESPRYSDHAHFSLPLWGMNMKHLQVEYVVPWSEIITLEDHLADCGFGSWLREAISHSPYLMCRVTSYALQPIVCGMVGSQSTLNALGGLKLPRA